MDRKFAGTMTHDQVFQWLNPEGMDHAQHYNRDRLLSDYIEISEETYWHFLEILPPMNWRNGYFAIIEATIDDVRLGLFKIKGKYYAAHVSDDDPLHALPAVAKLISEDAEILESARMQGFRLKQNSAVNVGLYFVPAGDRDDAPTTYPTIQEAWDHKPEHCTGG